MQRLVWIMTRDAAFTALVWSWQLNEDGTTEWAGEPALWRAA